MHTAQGKRWALLRRAFGVGGVAAVISVLAVFAGAGAAASKAKPVNTAPPRIAGTPQVGSTLQAHGGSWDNNPTSFDYQWLRCPRSGGNCKYIAGARSTQYTLTAVDVGHRIRLRVAATNADGTTVAISDPTAEVAKASPPVNTYRPSISGTAVEGKTLGGNLGTWANNPTSYRYAWLRCAKDGRRCAGITGATGRRYVLTSADVGTTLRFWVVAANAAGKTGATSASTAVVLNASVPPLPPPSQPKPVNTSLPTISGTPQVGSLLQGHDGDWDNNPTDFNHFWLRCAPAGRSCSFIAGATSKEYTLTSADVGHTIRLRVDARNADGTTTAYSAPTTVVTKPPAPVNTSPPTISGTPLAGETLTGTRGTWTNNPTAYAYSWFRCATNGGSCSAIVGANGAQNVLKSVDLGTTLRLHVVATNAGGQSGATSVPTAVIRAAPPPVPPRGPGCPPTEVRPDQVKDITPPARLLVDTLASDPQVVTGGTQTFVVKFHVTSTCSGPVEGALVYATATPYNQFSIPPETPTGADGWATLTFQRLQGFPVSPRQQLIAMFVRARKPGENLLLGISTRRLVSIPVNLKG